jgi:hypothetical protein
VVGANVINRVDPNDPVAFIDTYLIPALDGGGGKGTAP